METVGKFLMRAATIGQRVQKQLLDERGGFGVVKLVEFDERLEGEEELKELKAEVQTFADSWYMPGEEIDGKGE